MSKTRLDLNYLKMCKGEKLLPNFVQFKIPSTHLHHRRVINDCYVQILLNEIKFKKSELSRLYRVSKSVKMSIDLDLDHLIVCRLERIIKKLVVQKEVLIKHNHLKKFNKLKSQQHPPTIINKSDLSPIKNLSKRILTIEELNILENGLNFVVPNRRFDELSFISNIETCFVNLLGYTTDKKRLPTKRC
jgi:hypothetical protein